MAAYTHSADYGHLHLYTDVLGTEIWRTPSTRLDLRLFNSSACQKHQCTLCSLIVLFPFLSLKLSFYLSRSPALFRSSSLSLSPSLLYTAILRPFSLFLPLANICSYNALFSLSLFLSLILSSPPPFLHLRSTRYPSPAAAPFGVEND